MLDNGFYMLYGGGWHKFRAVMKNLFKTAKNPQISPDEMSVVVDPGTPLAPLQECIFVRDGLHIFHGVVSKKTDNGNSWKIDFKSMEWLLFWRAFGEFVYHAKSLNEILASDAPTPGTTGTVGALWRLNSEIANGKWTAHSATVAKLVDGGLKSQMGSSALYAYTTFPNAGSIDACDGIVQLTDAGAIPTAANKYYRTADDLWVRLGDGSYCPNAFIVAAANAFDTKIRLGSIDIGAYVNTADFSLLGQAVSQLEDLFSKAGREVQFLPHHDGYVYLNLAETIARGNASAPVKSYVDGKNCKVLLVDQLEPDYQAVLGVNSGDASQVPLVVTDWGWNDRPWIFGLHDYSGPSADMLAEIQAKIDNNLKSFKITSYDIDYHLRVGDYVAVTHPDLGTFVQRVQQWDFDGQKQVITTGKRVFKASEAFGEYLRGSIPDTSEPLSTTALTDGAGTFTILAADVAAGGLVVYYEDSFSQSDEGVQAEIGTFIDVKINGKIVPPGRLKLLNGGSVKIDITDFCNMSSSTNTSNTIARGLYRATGWGSDEGASKITQWRKLQFLAP